MSSLESSALEALCLLKQSQPPLSKRQCLQKPFPLACYQAPWCVWLPGSVFPVSMYCMSPPPPRPPAACLPTKRGYPKGVYHCRKCGQPKRGHQCTR